MDDNHFCAWPFSLFCGIRKRCGKGDKTDDKDITDEQTNIKYGTYILSLHYKDFGGWKETLAAYHAGAGNVKAWLNNPEYSTDGKTITKFPEKCSDTETYVNKVLKTQEIYKKLYYTE